MLLSAERKLAFIHVPKNGGTFMWHQFRKYVPDLKILTDEHDTHHYIPSPVFVSKLIHDGYYVFAFLRNPYDSLASNYFYIKRNSQHYAHSIVREMTFDEFAVEGPLTESLWLPDYLNQSYIYQGQYFVHSGIHILPFDTLVQTAIRLFGPDIDTSKVNANDGEYSLMGLYANPKVIEYLENNQKFMLDLKRYQRLVWKE